MNTHRVATGYYINLYTDMRFLNYDVYINLNEPNDEPTPDEVDIIEKELRPILDDDDMDISEKRDAAEKKLNSLDLNCLMYGAEIVFNY